MGMAAMLTIGSDPYAPSVTPLTPGGHKLNLVPIFLVASEKKSFENVKKLAGGRCTGRQWTGYGTGPRISSSGAQSLSKLKIFTSQLFEKNFLWLIRIK